MPRRLRTWHEDGSGPSCPTRLAWEGRVQPHHCFLLRRILAHIDFWEASIAEIQQEIEERLAPFEEAVTVARGVIDMQAIAAIMAEIGIDTTRFPSDKHFASWAGNSPGNTQSGGTRLSGATTSGNPYRRAMLGEVAWAIARTKDRYPSAFPHCIARRRGKQKAIMAALTVLVILYPVLQEKKPYTNLGAGYFDKLDTSRIQSHHVRRFEQLCAIVSLPPPQVVSRLTTRMMGDFHKK